MERTEPSLFPEWLKPAGTNGNGSSDAQAPVSLDDSTISHRSRQRNSFVGYDSSTQPATSDRTPYLPSRRTTGNGEREPYQHARGHFNFGRASSSRSFEVLDRERDAQRRVRDWDSEINSAGLDDGDNLNDTSRLPGTGARNSARYESLALRRSQSMSLPGRALENGDKKVTRETGLSTVPVNTGGFSGRIQKAAFDKNFPSLGSQGKYTALGGGNNPVSSPRLLKSSTFSKPDVSHSLSAGSSLSGSSTLDVLLGDAVNVNDLKGGRAALVPAANLTRHNLSFNDSSSSAGGAQVTSAAVHTLSSAILPKMATALAQNPPRVRSPPQVSSESQRLEELALKQSRQLIPMKPSLPKTMGSREKSKPKLVRSTDMAVPNTSKFNLSMTSSHLTSSTCRPPFSPKPEVSKLAQGKLLLLKTTKEKQAFDTTQPVSPTQLAASDGETGNMPRGKESVIEDKRTPLQSQNRTDFFNALRRKAAGNLITSDNTDKAELYQNSVINSRACTDENDKILADSVELESEIVDKEPQNSEISLSSISNSSAQEKACGMNGLIVDIPGIGLGHPGASDDRTTVSSEEEEAAFLRSLGWEEGTDEEEALTEEEINAFYKHKQTMQTMSRSVSLPLYNSQQSWRPAVNLRVGSIGSVSSGVGSSSDSDDEPHV